MDRKYTVIILGLSLSIGLFLIIILAGEFKLFSIPPEYIKEFIFILPGGIYTDILLIFAIPIAFFFLYYAISPQINWFYIKIHKFLFWMLRRPSQYGVFKLGATVKAGRLFYRALIVSFFSFSISFLLVSLGYAGLFRANMAPETASIYILNLAEAVFLGTFLICPIVVIIFFPIWQLEDSGVVSYRVFHDERMPADIQGVHSIYFQTLLGYAGISTVISWITIISEIFDKVPNIGSAVLTPIILIILPFVVTGILAIPIFLYERLFPRTNGRLFEKIKDFNFPEIEIPKFEELKK